MKTPARSSLISAHLLRRLMTGAVSLAATVGLCAGAELEGQVFDVNGKPLADQELVVLDAPRPSIIGRSPAPEPIRVVTRRTDAQGFFRFDLGAREFRGDVVLRLVPGEDWDAVRYSVPADRVVTRELKGGSAIVTIKVEDGPDWGGIAHEIRRYGEEDKRSEILRRHGFPHEVMTESGGRVEWRYARVTYVFQGGELREAQRKTDVKLSEARDDR